MTEDAQWLRIYVEEGSEAAFRELVERQVDLVYSTALRLADRNAHLAQDIAQQVFTDLARDAKSVLSRFILGGWLYRHTCFVASKMIRSERRRQAREKAAATMNYQDRQSQEEVLWQQLAPVLDQAISQLNQPDRDAIVLRFFQNKDLRQVGVLTGVSEDTAQKHVSRALEKLRLILRKQGITSTSTALATVLAGYAVSAAPAGLAAGLSSAALASAAVGSTTLTLTVLKLMAMTKVQLAMGALIVAGLGTTVVLEHQAVTKLNEENRALQARLDGSAPLKRVLRPRLPAPQMAAAAPAVGPAVGQPVSTNLLAQLLTGDESFKLSPQQVESYLEENRHSAESLLAAFRTTEDRTFLQEALEKYPNDPRVNFAAYFAARNQPDSSPEERRQRVDSFKRSAPDNALADYLSAQEHFNSGQTDEAVQDLIAASARSGFQDYSGEFIQNAEEVYRAAGYSEAEAKALAACTLPLPQLAQLKRLGQNLVELASLYRQSGDESSARAALQMGLNLAQQVGEPSGSHYLINELVGVNIESQILESIEPGSLYDSAGLTAKDRLEELARTREEIKRLGDPSTWMGGERRDVLLALWEQMPPQDLTSFYDRVKVSGEREALRWALNKLGKL